MELAIIGDTVLPYADIPPAYLDNGLYFGDGVYEVLRSYQGRIFALEEHLERFADSLAAIDITNIDLDTVRQRVLRGFAEAGLAEAKIYFHVTRGASGRDRDGPIGDPCFLMTVTTLKPGYSPEGIAVATHPDWRWKRCDIKSLNLLANVLARRAATAQGCDEAILVDETGHITEGSSSAFFAVCHDDRAGETWLQTAPLTANILPSVTRRYVLKAADVIGLPIREQSLRPEQAASMAEMFIAVTTHGIVPVISFDGHAVAGRAIGSWTARLQSAFEQFIRAC